jgi:predicted Zn-ribbon and HTH transcriptional regulator
MTSVNGVLAEQHDTYYLNTVTPRYCDECGQLFNDEGAGNKPDICLACYNKWANEEVEDD